MEGLPASFVDFKAALKALVDSQTDVLKLVTAWSQIMDTDTPGTVDITLTDGIKKTVDNLAKIREDLVAGLSLENPKVTSITARSSRSSSTMEASRGYGWSPVVSGLTASGLGLMGYYGNVGNVMRSMVYLDSEATLELQDVPRVLLLGLDGTTDYTLTVNPPNNEFLNSVYLIGGIPYVTTVTFVNRKINGTKFTEYVTLNINGNSRRIPPGMSASYLMWVIPGEGNMVVLHEIVHDITGGVNEQ